MFSQRQVPHTKLPNSLHSFLSIWTSTKRHADVVSKTSRGAKATHTRALTHTLVVPQALLCFQCNGDTAGGSQEACGGAVLSKMQQAAGRAKNNIIRATKELVKELKGDVPQGRNTFYSQWDHS